MTGNIKGKVLAVCTSKTKGVVKTPQDYVDIKKAWGIVDDAHAGNWHRQVSLLAKEDAEIMEKINNESYPAGAFAENILTSGLNLTSLPLGTIIDIGSSVRLEITQKGKTCHTGCEIKKKTGDCIMPRCGIFTKVLEGGRVRPGDEINIVSTYRFAIVVVSTSCTKGERIDTAGEEVAKILKMYKFNPMYKVVVPDDKTAIKKELLELSSNKANPCHLILTVGGTGLSPDDVTPDATEDILERRVPGIPELMRASAAKSTQRSYLSRGVAGIRSNTLIINLPGSLRGASESVASIVPVLPHALRMMAGEHYHHGNK